MPKTSHQHFSVALLSKVNDKNWPETKIWKASCVTFFQYLRKKTNQILITIYEADVHTQIQIAAKPPWLYFQVSKTLPPQPRFLNLFIFVLTKSLFSMPWMSTSCRRNPEKIHRNLYKKISNFLQQTPNQNISQ